MSFPVPMSPTTPFPFDTAAACIASVEQSVALDRSSRDRNAAAIDLMTRLLQLRDASTARAHCAQLLVEFLDADFVLVGASSSQSIPCPISSLHGPSLPDQTFRDDLEAAIGESVTTGRAHHTGSAILGESLVIETQESMFAGLAHQRLAMRLGQDRVIHTVPLIGDDDQSVGAILIGWSVSKSNESTVENGICFMKVIAKPLAGLILALECGKPGLIAMRMERAKQWFTRSRLRWFSLALFVVGVVGTIPVRYPVGAEVTVVPVVSRHVVAPFAGILKQVLVKPGQSVEVGQQLLLIDCEDTVERITSLRAELEKTRSERSKYLSTVRLSDAALAGWTAKRIESELHLLHRYLERSEVRSPIAGVVLGEDLERLVGCPLETGQGLLEIAQIAPMQAVIEVPPDQITRIALDDEATIELESVGSLGEVKVSSIYPRAEPNEQGKYVFRALADLPKQIDPLKSGMRGSAVIYGKRCPWAWCVVQRIWTRLHHWS